MKNIIQNFYEQNRITFFTLNDYSSIKTQVVPSIAYVATLICLSCIFSSSLKSPEKTSFLANKAGLLLQESSKLGLSINLYRLIEIRCAATLKPRRMGMLEEKENAFYRSTLNIFTTRTITNLALYCISFLLIARTSTLKLSPSLMRYSFLNLTHLLALGFYAKESLFSLRFLAQYMSSIRSSDELFKLFELAIEYPNASCIKAVMKHEKFDYHLAKDFKKELIELDEKGILSKKDMQEINEIQNALLKSVSRTEEEE